MGEGAALGTVHDCKLLSKKNYRLVKQKQKAHAERQTLVGLLKRSMGTP